MEKLLAVVEFGLSNGDEAYAHATMLS